MTAWISWPILCRENGSGSDVARMSGSGWKLGVPDVDEVGSHGTYATMK